MSPSKLFWPAIRTQAAELRPYLETAAQLSGLASQPTIAAQQQSQAGFLAAAAALKNPQSAPMPIWFTLRRLLMPLASLAVILFLSAFTPGHHFRFRAAGRWSVPCQTGD